MAKPVSQPVATFRSYLIFFSMMTIAACGVRKEIAPPNTTDFVEVGSLEDPTISEASGLTRSSRDDRLWVVNDGGSAPLLYAIGLDGSDHGSVMLDNARNVDWEDLASFGDDDKHWLIVADIGDNNARREEHTLYVVPEPGRDQLSSGTVTAHRLITFRYPDGPRDAESIAVDTTNGKILILTKRDIPAVLYSLPLYPDSTDVVTATRIGEIVGIPQPTPHDIERAIPDQNWHWQPNAMDISAAGDLAVILTYRAIYCFSRREGQSWFAALQSEPLRFDLGEYREAESAVFSSTGEQVYVTTEERSAPMLRIDLTQEITNGIF